MQSSELHRVPLENLRKTCKMEELDFCTSTEDMMPLKGFIGQERAVRAMQFGLAMDAPYYNIFVVGQPGTGKSTYVQAVVTKAALEQPLPDDWCYIYNFVEPDRPIAVSLPVGEGRVFQKTMEGFVAELRSALPRAFGDSDYEQQKETIVQSVNQTMAGYFHELEEEANKTGFSLKQTPKGIVFIPVKDGEPLSQEEFGQLSAQQKKEIEEVVYQLRGKLEGILHTGRMLEKEAEVKLRELEKQIALAVLEPLLDQIKEKYQGFPVILNYLDNVLKDVTANLDMFKTTEPKQQSPYMQLPQEGIEPITCYRVNLFVNNEHLQGAPVIIEHSPSYYNLFGKIEYRGQVLSMNTDFTLVKPGAIHRANGGYLILQAKDVLGDPLIWGTLKKALQYRQAMIENIGEQYRLVPTSTFRPEPIPLNIKVILIGNPMLYHLLFNLDEDFQKLFKVKVDFDTEMPRNQENLRHFVAFVSSVCQRENLKHFSRSGLAQLIEYGSRLAGDQNKLSTRFNEVVEIINEAAALAKARDSQYVEGSHVQEAIKERVYRYNKIEEKLQELALQGTILINTDGAVVGQVNGLTVIDSGGYTFGRPIRITARTYMGRGGVINIERETNMSGNIHDKGVLTLGGYLGGKFAQNNPLGVTAQITFEQLYEGVEGDSASSAELYAILSSLADLPLKQSLAVTGSVNQFGEIQPIRGVTEKIEGFFDLCRARGLTGDQGVIIPVQNIANLMLKEEVVQAVEDNLFHVYAIRNIEEGIELLSGLPAGEKGEDGHYPENTVFYLVEKKLQGAHRSTRTNIRLSKTNVQEK